MSDPCGRSRGAQYVHGAAGTSTRRDRVDHIGASGFGDRDGFGDFGSPVLLEQSGKIPPRVDGVERVDHVRSEGVEARRVGLANNELSHRDKQSLWLTGERGEGRNRL